MPRVYFCPYYQYDNRLHLRCENAHIDFKSNGQKSDYIGQYCASICGWRQCTLAKMLDQIYADEKAAPR